MKWSTLFRRVRYYAQFIPFTRFTLFIALLCWLLVPLLFATDNEISGTSAQQPFVWLLTKIALALLLSLIALSVLSTLIAWLLYISGKKNGAAGLHIQIDEKSKEDRSSLSFHAGLQKAYKPLLGYVLVRWVYDGYFLSKTFGLFSRKKADRAIISYQPYGQAVINVPHIKKYRIQEYWIFFQDLLRIISLPVREKTTQQFSVPPSAQINSAPQILPFKTETTEIRIDEMRRTEGEWTHYKDYESGDDIRRINWRVYARHKNLMVRIPEKFEPYASHLYLFQSFHLGLEGIDENNEFILALLNEYKEKSWALIQQIMIQFPDVRYQNDQTKISDTWPKEAQQIQQAIILAQWQTQTTLQEIISPQKSHVLILHSLNRPKDVANTLAQLPQDVPVFFIPLSGLFTQKAFRSALENILFLPPDDHLKKLKNRWWHSSVKPRILKNERQMKELIQNMSHAAVLELSAL